MKVLQINTTANTCSHGRIAESIGSLLINQGNESCIAYGRAAYNCRSDLIKIGNKADLALHLVKTRLFDRHGFGSVNATRLFIKNFDRIKPDIIHLHNLHGYYLNIKSLFEYLKSSGRPVVWTLHDCWPFTGHCSHFQFVNCMKWQTVCYECPLTHGYPKSWGFDNSYKNYLEKKRFFTGVKNMVLVSPSEWLVNHLRASFLSNYDIRLIFNGVDTDKFTPVNSEQIKAKYKLNKKYILGVASIWTEKKGLKDFIELRKILDPQIEIVLVGLSKAQIKILHSGMIGIIRTENVNELAALYSGAEVFVNPTYVDNFPLVNIESLACGTPVTTYNTGGSSEAIDIETGIVVEKGNLRELHGSIMQIIFKQDHFNSAQCRARALKMFTSQERYRDYINLYHERLMK